MDPMQRFRNSYDAMASKGKASRRKSPMEIQGKVKADVVKFTIAANTKKDGLTADVDLDVGLDQETAARLMGDDVAGMLFNGVREEVIPGDDGDATEYVFPWGKWTAPSRLKCAKHLVSVEDGKPFELQPALVSAKPVKDSPKVVARIRLPFHIGGNKSNCGALGVLTGSSVRIEFSPQQVELPLGDRVQQ